MSLLTQLSERAGSHRRLSLVSVIGLVLVPFVIAGVLVWALWNPQDRLDTLSAAIVNSDQPVTVNGQTVPLGRELSAGLVGTAKPGSKKAGQNFSWRITDEKDASAGLASGEYTAVIRIPKDFSAAATSTQSAADARKATISVQTSDSAKVLDETISQTIAQTAASTLGTSLTSAYLDNIYLGFNNLGDKLGQASSGADQLASQGGSLASGMQQSAAGQQQLATGLGSLASGANGLATGASGLSNGVQQLSGGAQSLASGAQQTAAGAQSLASGLQQLDAQAAQLGQLSQLGSALTGAGGIVGVLQQQQANLGACSSDQASVACQTAIATFAGLAQKFTPAQLSALSSGLSGANDQLGQLTQLPGAISQLSSGADQLAAGTAQLSSGASGLASGLGQTASGAKQLASGASSLASGAQQSASGAQQAADAGAQLASGTQQYVDGVGSLASGLDTAVKSLPSYSAADRTKLSTVVASPVSAKTGAATSFGELAAPIFGVLALWLGALACFVVVRPVTVLALGSPRSSLNVALRGLVVPAVVGAVQGIAVAGALQPLLDLAPGPWLGLAGVGMLAGVAFAAVNQALVALFGGTGRFISMLVILLGLATGLVGTAPRFMSTITEFTPVAPAQHLVGAIVDGTAVSSGSIVALALWLLGSIAVTTFAVARGRVLPASKLAPAASGSPAAAPV